MNVIDKFLSLFNCIAGYVAIDWIYEINANIVSVFDMRFSIYFHVAVFCYMCDFICYRAMLLKISTQKSLGFIMFSQTFGPCLVTSGSA